MGAVALDSSVLIALMNRRDAHHQAAGDLLRAQPTATRFLIGATVYAEILARAARLGTTDRVESSLDRLDVEIVAVPGRSHAGQRHFGRTGFRV